MFKNVNKVFNEISLGCKQLIIQNNLIISDCIQVLGNASFLKKNPHPFSIGVDDQSYLLGCMWLYLVGLSLAPNIFGYVGSHFLGHK